MKVSSQQKAVRGIRTSEQRASKILVVFIGSLLTLFLLTAAQAQQPGKVYRIGYLAPGPVDEAFRQGLRELGYTEGKNLIIEHGQGPERYPELAADLVRLRVDCILAVGIAATRAAKMRPIRFRS
jgi:hypothetical protein